MICNSRICSLDSMQQHVNRARAPKHVIRVEIYWEKKYRKGLLSIRRSERKIKNIMIALLQFFNILSNLVMNGSLSNSSAVARWSGSNVKARPRKVRNLKTRMFKWTMLKKICKNRIIFNWKLNLAEIVFQLLNSGRPLEAIKNIALIGDSFMYGGWPWTESYTVLYQIYSPGQKVTLIRTYAGLSSGALIKKISHFLHLHS